MKDKPEAYPTFALLLLLLLALALIGPYMFGTAPPSADVELARWYAKNRFQVWGWQAEWGGGSPVWMAGPPGFPLVTAVPASAGVPVEAAHEVIAGLFYALGSAAVFYLAHALGLPAWWAALAFTVAPYRWSDLVREANASHAAGLALTTSILACAAARKGGLRMLALLAMLALFWFPPPPQLNLLPELELAIVLVAAWVAKRTGRILPVAACVAVFATGLIWKVFFERASISAGIEPATARWLARHTSTESVLGMPAPRPSVNPIRTQAEDLILFPRLSPRHLEHSVLWMQALGLGHVIVSDAGKYRSVLEPEREDSAGYCVYQAPARRPVTAVLVSRHQWRSLPRPRSLYDLAFLLAYVNWSNRPEGVGFTWKTAGVAEVRADLGPDDMILVRQNAAPGWRATSDGRAVPYLRDPIGFLLLDPGRTGPITVLLSAPAWRARYPSASPLPTDTVPSIDDGGIIDGVLHTPPPFAPGTIITIYGRDLATAGAAHVVAAGRPVEVLYAGDRQINARLPLDLPLGTVEITVEAAGVRSDPVPIEIAPE